MTKLPIIVAATLGLAASATAMSAQTELDADGDGLYSYNEMIAAFPDLTEETFLTMDANGDGAVDADELTVARDGGMLPEEAPAETDG